MNKASLFDVARGILWGCGVAILVFLLLLAVEIAFETSDLYLNLKSYFWVIAVGVGGYFACRQAKNRGWLNSLVFGLLAEIFVFIAVPDANREFIMAGQAADRWHFLLMLMLTLPAALLGGYLWTRSNKDRDGHTKHVGNTLDA